MYNAEKYHLAGFSVIPISGNKIPIGAWKKAQSQAIDPENNPGFKDTKFLGIGLVAGKVSGNLQCLDIDLKYDLNGTLYEQFKLLINDNDPNLLKKMVVQQTPSGGYHFLFRCSEMEGNKKLASRYATDYEKTLNPKEKVKVLLETRGEGGYFMVAPSPGYKIIYGDVFKLNEITPEERSLLFDCARTFNEVVETVKEKKEIQKIYSENLSPFDDYNNRGDVLGLLQDEGWKITMQRGSKNLLLRPGGTGKWSADWDDEKRIFYVFTSSSEFENEKGYNPVQVLAYLKFNKDYSATAKYLLSIGYGEKPSRTKKEQISSKINIDDDNFDFIAADAEINEYLDQVRDGTFKMGATTGIPSLDNHFRIKDANLVIINGHDNTGKSTIVWYQATLTALCLNWRWLMFSSENKTGGIARKLMEFYWCKPLKNMTNEEYHQARKFVKEHFVIIRNNELYNYKEIISIGRKVIEREEKSGKTINGFLVDPYNSLVRSTDNFHEYDYAATNEFKLFIQQTGCSVFLNCHAVTEALRRTYPKGHIFEGYPMPPSKADTEGGGKFSNKADDFITIHRMTHHSTEWNVTEIHVRKIKELETGGMPTMMDKPVKLKGLPGGVGFVEYEKDFMTDTEVLGKNPILEYWKNKNGIKEPVIKNIDFTISQREQKELDEIFGTE